MISILKDLSTDPIPVSIGETASRSSFPTKCQPCFSDGDHTIVAKSDSGRNGVESDGCSGGGGMERNCSVPHVRREQNKPSRHRLDRAAHGALHGGLEGRLAEFDPALLG